MEQPLSQHFHAVVWIDHHEARVFHFNADDVERAVVPPHEPTRHIHHKAHSIGSGHSPEDQHFFHAVVDHPTDCELLAHARQYFRAADRMAPQRS